jgi:orotidine-5'-phosphate decarboxylase
MPSESFGDRLANVVRAKRNAVCVGLDPRALQLPNALQVSSTSSLADQANAFERFCFAIIDVVHSLVPVVKPQSAFFEELGPHGVVALANVCQYASSKGLLVVMDAKRNDIGTTATAYANAYLGRSPLSPFGCDALTVSPYLGSDSLEPFIARCQTTRCGLFVLVKTSNPGSGFLQDQKANGVSISETVATYVQERAIATATSSGSYGAIGAVVGATYPEQLRRMRELMPNAWLLIPGYGAQGGSAKDVVQGMDREGLGAIVNSSRGIIFAYETKKFGHASSWQHAVELATVDMINAIRSELPGAT